MKYILNLNVSNLFRAFFYVIAVGIAGCSQVGDLDSEPGPLTCLRFTDGEDYDPEYIHASCASQTLELRVISTTHEAVPLPECLDYLYIREWNDSIGDFDTSDSDNVNQPDDFYHVSVEQDEKGPVVKIDLKTNITNEERKVFVSVGDFSNKQNKTVGAIVIVQNPDYSLMNAFTLKAKYKDNVYESIVQLDSIGNFIYMNPEYQRLMNDIDMKPFSSLVILSDSMLYYYDRDDVILNKVNDDIAHLVSTEQLGDMPDTRATGFEDIENGYLGYMAVYDNDNFKGKMIYKGLANFHFAHTLPMLKSYGMNDNITSIAVAYNGSDPSVCAVLTIWDDSYFNHGDNDRKKHRITIISSVNNPRVTWPDLKKVKKIGSSSSWNDCISSLSLHFGYVDSPLLGY